MNQINKDITIGKCYNCSTNMDYQNTFCGGLCFICWQCEKIQYLDDDDKINKWHNPQCEDYNNCYHCDKNIDLDKNNIIDYTNNDYIFNKEPEKFIAKYNNMFYHYDCLCKFLGDDYIRLVCSKCKIYYKNSTNMRNINNYRAEKHTLVCINCFDESDIPKCYNNGCDRKYVLPICCETKGRYKYAIGCKKCSNENWIKAYCNWCR